MEFVHTFKQIDTINLAERDSAPLIPRPLHGDDFRGVADFGDELNASKMLALIRPLTIKRVCEGERLAHSLI